MNVTSVMCRPRIWYHSIINFRLFQHVEKEKKGHIGISDLATDTWNLLAPTTLRALTLSRAERRSFAARLSPEETDPASFARTFHCSGSVRTFLLSRGERTEGKL
ncbi:hypothetical protein N7510_001805 [Penicillium lagena]|uniref:uncharacterized protein n=1 Tax=Penicillium lagena TaxID=94218 RepID=UPI002541AD17|nr:uncharacterized protein N7510_001805 [Penicillium lagena]KAJ5625496.1 hypothetical protein N7510_001805 [Penicillium lagena]